MTNQLTQTVGNIVASNFKTASVFKQHNIDFCCNGNRLLQTVCDEKNINVDTIMQELNAAITDSEDPSLNYQDWSIDLLAEYIQNKHHKYVEKKITEIKPYLGKIAMVHGNHHPELHDINKLFNDCADDLTTHMKKEELILFPYIKNLAEMKKENVILKKPSFGTIENPIAMMQHDHNIEGDFFKQISELSSNYTVPADGCNTYRVTFGLLKEFEEDLHLHIHLENNILFPKAIELEQELFN